MATRHPPYFCGVIASIAVSSCTRRSNSRRGSIPVNARRLRPVGVGKSSPHDRSRGALNDAMLMRKSSSLPSPGMHGMVSVEWSRLYADNELP